MARTPGSDHLHARGPLLADDWNLVLIALAAFAIVQFPSPMLADVHGFFGYRLYDTWLDLPYLVTIHRDLSSVLTTRGLRRLFFDAGRFPLYVSLLAFALLPRLQLSLLRFVSRFVMFSIFAYLIYFILMEWRKFDAVLTDKTGFHQHVRVIIPESLTSLHDLLLAVLPVFIGVAVQWRAGRIVTFILGWGSSLAVLLLILRPTRVDMPPRFEGHWLWLLHPLLLHVLALYFYAHICTQVPVQASAWRGMIETEIGRIPASGYGARHLLLPVAPLNAKSYVYTIGEDGGYELETPKSYPQEIVPDPLEVGP